MAAPSPGPKNLVVKRSSDNDGNALTASWGNPADALWESDHKWGGVDETWWFNASRDMSSAVTQQRGSGHPTGDIIWVRDQGITESTTVYYDRSKYHPLTANRYLSSVLAYIYAYNGSTDLGGGTGNTRNAAGAKFTYAFQKPRAPEISDPELESGTGTVTFSIDTDEGEDAQERYDTMYCITRQDSADRGNTWKAEKVAVAWTSTTDTSKEVSIDVSDAQALTFGQWVKVTCKAYARGLAGDSATSTKSYVYAYPAQARITSIVCSGLSGTDVVTVRLSTDAASTAPVDSVKLQRLADTAISSAAAASSASGWQDVSGAVDNGVCSGLSDQVSAALPSAKKHTWYRVVSTHGSLTRNSLPVEATCLYRAKTPQADDEVTFLSLVPGDDGTSLIARIAWDDDDSNTTQISWSAYEDAWESTEQPTAFGVTWEDETPESGHDHSATVSIRGLEQDSAVYVRARRGSVTDSAESWGDWCVPDPYPAYPVLAPTDVALWAPASVERGGGIDCQWTHTGSPQAAWQIINDDGSRKELMSGEGPGGAATIPASLVEGLDSLMLSVCVTAGGSWSESGQVPVSIDETPELGIAVAQTLTAQPLAITMACTVPRASVAVYVTSRGVIGDSPTGERIQAAGDIVWAEVAYPDWVLVNGAWTATVTAPSTLDLRDGATYDVTASATDRDTQLGSGVEADSFTVAWAHQAVCPSQDSVVTVDSSALSAEITPVAPENAAETDVCDVYRKTPDGCYLIASDVPFGGTVTDLYAPFASRSETSYRLCTRTKDGDLDWTDIPYALRKGCLRVDWGDRYVELPYNVGMSNSWERDDGIRTHMDGTTTAHFPPGTVRRASFSSDVVKVTSEAQREALSALARHSGPAFVRTADGAAFCASVQVDSYGVSYDSAAVPVCISATEVDLADAYKAAPMDWGGQ